MEEKLDSLSWQVLSEKIREAKANLRAAAEEKRSAYFRFNGSPEHEKAISEAAVKVSDALGIVESLEHSLRTECTNLSFTPEEIAEIEEKIDHEMYDAELSVTDSNTIVFSGEAPLEDCIQLDEEDYCYECEDSEDVSLDDAASTFCRNLRAAFKDRSYGLETEYKITDTTYDTSKAYRALPPEDGVRRLYGSRVWVGKIVVSGYAQITATFYKD